MSSVYVISSVCGHFKIGVAENVQRRLRQLQAANPTELTVIKIHTSMKRQIAEQIECRAHHVLREYRTYGEWFKCSSDVACLAVQDAASYVRNRRGGLAWSSNKIKRNLGAA